MSNSTTNLDLIDVAQGGKETTANELFDAVSPSSAFGRHASATSGLTWGYYGGTVLDVDGVPTQVANGTITLTASATNYLYIDQDTSGPHVAKTTSAPTGWPGPITSPANATALYRVVTGTSSVTSYQDFRLAGGIPGATGPAGPPDDPFVTLVHDTSGDADTDASLGHNFKVTLESNGVLTNPTNLTDGQVINWYVKQGTSGGHTLTYGSKFKFAESSNAPGTGANARNLISCVYHAGEDILICTLAKNIA